MFSAGAARQLITDGHYNVFILEGGFQEWYEAGYPCEELTEEEYSFED